MIYLVTHIDPDILKRLLEWGARNGMKEKVIQWEDEGDQDKMEDTEQPEGGWCWQGMCLASGQSSRKSFVSKIMEEENVNEEAYMRKNPLRMSVLQGYIGCSRLLHRFGWRIPQVAKKDGKVECSIVPQVRGAAKLEGAQEAVRQQVVTWQQQNNEMDQVFNIFYKFSITLSI